MGEPASFVQDLDRVADQVEMRGDAVTVGEIESLLGGRGFATLCLILCVPFVQPVPLPGLSVVFGLAIAALGVRLAFGKAGGLPLFIRRRTVKADVLRKVIAGARKIFGYVERLFRRRLDFVLRPPLLNLIGVSIAASGLALSLPLPPVILFSNSMPAWGIILLCLGYLERDGLVVLAGHAVAIATWVYLAFWWEAVKYGFESLATYLQWSW